LVDHFVDCAFESSNLGITLFGTDEHLLAEIAISDGSDDAANLAQDFLVGGIDLLVLRQLALESFDIVHGALNTTKSLLGGLTLLLQSVVDAVDVFFLSLDLFALAINMVTKNSELFFSQLTRYGGAFWALRLGQQTVHQGRRARP
jgi:hypothetical protein